MGAWRPGRAGEGLVTSPKKIGRFEVRCSPELLEAFDTRVAEMSDQVGLELTRSEVVRHLMAVAASWHAVSVHEIDGEADPEREG